MDTPCKKCSADIDVMNSLYTVCEGRCAKKFHATCVGVTENDLCALSKNIIWICDDCMIEFCKARDHTPVSPKNQPIDENSFTAGLDDLRTQVNRINESIAKLSIAISSSIPSVSTQRHSTPNHSPQPLSSASVCTSGWSQSSSHNREDTFPLLLTNIDRQVSENEIICLVSQCLGAPEPECANVTKLVSGWKNCNDLDYISFKIVLPIRWKLLAMTASTWPRGVIFR